MCRTCVGDGGVFVQGDQRRIQQNNVSVLSDHPVVRRLNPRLVFVHCGDKERRVSESLCATGKVSLNMLEYSSLIISPEKVSTNQE